MTVVLSILRPFHSDLPPVIFSLTCVRQDVKHNPPSHTFLLLSIVERCVWTLTTLRSNHTPWTSSTVTVTKWWRTKEKGTAQTGCQVTTAPIMLCLCSRYLFILQTSSKFLLEWDRHCCAQSTRTKTLRTGYLIAVYFRRGLTCTLGLTNDLTDGGQPRAKNCF